MLFNLIKLLFFLLLVVCSYSFNGFLYPSINEYNINTGITNSRNITANELNLLNNIPSILSNTKLQTISYIKINSYIVYHVN